MLSLSIKVIYSGMNAPWRRYNFGIWVKLKKNTLMPLRIWIPIYQCQVKLVRNQKCASIHPFSTAQNAQNSTYSSIQNKNILSVTQWELLLFHVLTLELFIALELTQKRTFTNKKIFGGSIVFVTGCKYFERSLSWLRPIFLAPAYYCFFTGETYRQSSYSKSFNVVLFMWLHVSKQ